MRVYHYILKTEQFKDTLLHEASLSVSKIKLVGGEKEWEGNIIVGGKPVCDDGAKHYGEAVAQVVCRFILFWHKTIINIFITIFFSQGSLGTMADNIPKNHTSAKSPMTL